MNTPQSATPHLQCRPLPAFEAGNWDDVARAFATMASCEMGQHWLSKPEPGFRPATVRVGWHHKTLWIYAELSDDDIYNAADGFNQDTCQLGDVFEIFLRPAGVETYYEFHVTPENQVMQLRWPSLEVFKAQTALPNVADGLRPFLIKPRVIQSRTKIERDQNRWRVLVGMDSDIFGVEYGASDEPWLFSFCRYDCTRGETNYVLSSTSPYTKASYHRMHEWGSLHFEPRIEEHSPQKILLEESSRSITPELNSRV